MKTNEEFKERNFTLVDNKIWGSKNLVKALVEALSQKSKATIQECKTYKFHKKRSPVTTKYLKNTYVIEEPFSTQPNNLFVPHTNSFADKLQGLKKIRF